MPSDVPVPSTSWRVRAFYTETDAGHLFGPFLTRAAAEACVQVLAGRPEVIAAVIEGV